MAFQIALCILDEVLVLFKDTICGLCRAPLWESNRVIRMRNQQASYRGTYKFAYARAIVIVDLYPASMFLNPEMSSPIYLNLSQSLLLPRSSVEC